MTLKIILLASLLLACSLLWSCTRSVEKLPVRTIDSNWWNSLSEEWKTILLINQNFSKQGVDIFKLQEQYLNRLNNQDDEPLSPQNTALHELIRKRSFQLGVTDLYNHAVRNEWMTECKDIDLISLHQLDTIYMTNGPGDLTPLEYFPQLKVLVLNSCGVGLAGSVSKPLDLSPLKHLKELKVLHCSSIALENLDVLRSLNGLEELYCEQSSITSLMALKNLKKLRKLSFGPGIEKVSEAAELIELEELYIRGCKKVPDLSRLKKLKKLSIEEGEMAVVNSTYRIKNIDFLKDLNALKYLDIYFTSFAGSNEHFIHMKNLKAVTLPSSMSNNEVLELMCERKDLKVINSYSFE